MGAMASQITSLTIVYSTVHSGADQRKHQSSAWLAFVRGIHRWPVNSLHKWSVTRKMFPFHDVIMMSYRQQLNNCAYAISKVYFSPIITSGYAVAGQKKVCHRFGYLAIPLLRCPFLQKYYTDYFKISYDECLIFDNKKATIIISENIDLRCYITWLRNRNILLKNQFASLKHSHTSPPIVLESAAQSLWIPTGIVEAIPVFCYFGHGHSAEFVQGKKGIHPRSAYFWTFWFMVTSSNGELFRVNWPFVRGIHRAPVNSPHKGQWRGAFMFSLVWAWTNGWVNNREAGDLRRHLAHYDVIVMIIWETCSLFTSLQPKCSQQNHPDASA